MFSATPPILPQGRRNTEWLPEQGWVSIRSAAVTTILDSQAYISSEKQIRESVARNSHRNRRSRYSMPFRDHALPWLPFRSTSEQPHHQTSLELTMLILSFLQNIRIPLL